jgi:hypothetical protein
MSRGIWPLANGACRRRDPPVRGGRAPQAAVASCEVVIVFATESVMTIWAEPVKGITVMQNTAKQSDPEFQESWAEIPSRHRFSIENGIVTSRLMVSSALEGLDIWVACNSGASREWYDMDLAAEVDNGLHKYFHLARQQLQVKSGGKGGIVVRGIKAVFLKIQAGLDSMEDCEIELRTFLDTKTWAGVSPEGKERSGHSASPIRAEFGFTDEFGHTPWKGLGGPIMLNTHWLKRPAEEGFKKMEEVARTLVHEASHRFAQTKDILYKQSSLGARLKEEDKLEMQRLPKPGESQVEFDEYRGFAKEYIQQKSAETQITSRAIAGGGRAEVKQRSTGLQKALVSLAPKSGPEIQPVQWLENADSYAWFARRVWKRMGSPEK